MPSTQNKKFSFERACSDLYGAGGEPPGEPPAPPLRSAEASRTLSAEVVEQALGRARLGRSVADMSDQAREELIEALLDQLRGERGELPEELRDRLLDGMIDELIAGKRGEREILGRDGVLGEITRRMVQRALEEELTEHLGYPAGQAPPGGVGNSRNGGTPKTLLTDQGPVRIDTPREGYTYYRLENSDGTRFFGEFEPDELRRLDEYQFSRRIRSQVLREGQG